MANPLRVNAAELLRRAGNTKQIDLDASPAELGLVDPRFAGDSDVHVSLRLEALTDGIVVDGTLRATWHGTCRRCAVPVGGPLVSEVHELYQEYVTDPDAFAIDGEQLDLEPMVRELLVLDAPSNPLCRPDCQGLCPVCGVDRNTTTCACTTAASDPRWAALDQLRTDPGS